MGIQQPIVTEIAYQTYCINEFGMDTMFLLLGSDSALLIDTGTGAFDVKALCESLTNLPLKVVLTHGHVDHAGGIGYFNEIFLHPDDYQMAKKITRLDRLNYLNTMRSISDGLFDVSSEQVRSFDHLPSFRSLKEGQDLPLGNRDIIVYETPGHTKGSLSFLDTKERLLFSGDACNINTLLMGGTLNDLLDTAKKIDRLGAFYDRYYNGHIGYATNLNCLPQHKDVVRDANYLLEKLMNHEIEGVLEDSPFMGLSYYARYGHFGVRYYLM